MRTWLAILLTLGLIGGLASIAGGILIVPMVVGTSVWIGIDSERLHLRRYRSGISYSPVVLGILCSSFWVVAFPWYLSMRHKILTGPAELREEFKPWRLADGQMSERGLIQPWRGRAL